MVSQIEGKHKDHPAPDFHKLKSENELNDLAAFAKAHQRYFTIIITMVKSQTPLIKQPVVPRMHQTLP